MTNRPRIVYVVHDFPPEAIAGAELHTSWLAEELSKDYQIFIFTTTHDPSLEEYTIRDEEFQGLKVRRAKFSNRDWVHPSDFYLNLRIGDIFSSYIDEIQPALIHIHHTIGLSATIIELAAARRIPTILQLRDFHYMCQRTHLLYASGKLCTGPLNGAKCADCIQADSRPYTPKDLASLYSRAIFEQAGVDRTEYMRTLLRLPNLVVCPSEFLKEKFIEFDVPASKIRVSPQGVKVEAFQKQRYRGRDEKIVFGFLSNIAYHKGPQVLIEAFASLDQSRAELQMYGGGDAALTDRLQARVQDLNVKFMGKYSHEQLPEILSNLDAVVHPSICHESYSIVVHEALAAGVPVIVSDIPAQREAVRNGVDGLHFHAGDSEDLSRKMKLLIENPDILTNLRMHTPQVRAISDQAKEFTTIYEELMREANRENPNTETLIRLEKIRQRIDRKSLEQQIILRRHFVSEVGDWIKTLLAIYDTREDLQRSFPEARRGELDNLVEWAIDVMQRKHPDSSYEEIMATASKPLFMHLSQLVDELRDRDEIKAKLTGELESLRRQMVEDLRKRDEAIREIESSLAWKLINTYRRIISRLFPVGTRRRRFLDLLTIAVSIAAEKGFRSLISVATKRYLKLRRDFYSLNLDEQYQVWLKNNELTEQTVNRMREEAGRFQYRPKISVVMPVYNTDSRWLKKAIDSVIRQLYTSWEVCIADDGSTRKHVKRILEEYRLKDPRIKVVYLEKNSGIAAASNAALSLAGGEFVGFLDHDDELALDALYEVVKLLNEQPDIDYIYSDEDKMDLNGRRLEPFFKPDWSPDLMLTMNYVTHYSVVRKSLLDRIGGFRVGFEGSQDYDLLLRVTENTSRIAHITKPLYSWRRVPGSGAAVIDAKPYALVAAMKALQEALDRRGIEGQFTTGYYRGHYRVRYRIKGEPQVTIIILNKNNSEILRRCLESIESKTTYRNYEIIIVDHDSEDPETIEYLKSLRHKVVRYSGEYNFSKMNNLGVKEADGEHILFLNNDTEVVEPGWLEAMLEHSQRPEVGEVGALLLYPPESPFAGKIQHAGVLIGVGGVANSAFKHLPADSPTYFTLGKVIKNCSALTAACAMMRRSVFEEVGGFDEALPVAFNDIDLSLRLREKGYLIVYTPFAVLYHREYATRAPQHPPEDETYFLNRWKTYISKGDPYYNPNLTFLKENYGLTPKSSEPRPLALLLDLYYFRGDLQKAYPEARKGKYQRLIDWAGRCGVGLDGARYLLRPCSSWYIDNASEEAKPLAVLLELYNSDSDLQRSFPEVLKGDYKRLIEWASEIREAQCQRNPALKRLLPYLSRYKSWYNKSVEAS